MRIASYSIVFLFLTAYSPHLGQAQPVHVRLEQKRQPIVHLMGAMGHSGSGVGHGSSGGWEHEHGSSGSGSKAIVGAATALVAAGGAAYGAYRWLKSSKKNNPDEKGGQPML